MNKEDSGRVFDITKDYSQNSKEVRKLLDHFFTDKEVKGKKVLDAGCRVGDYSYQMYDKGASLVKGVDLSKKCIEVAKKKFNKNKSLKFEVKNINDLSSFEDSTFDIVICVGTIFYLPPKGMKKALNEFIRVTKPNGKILVMFQKKKGFLANSIKNFINIIPLKFYTTIVEKFSYLIRPLISKILMREVSNHYLKYDILLSLRGIHFGVPLKISKKFLVKTPNCEQCSEKTTTSYKIKVSKEKQKIDLI